MIIRSCSTRAPRRNSRRRSPMARWTSFTDESNEDPRPRVPGVDSPANAGHLRSTRAPRPVPTRILRMRLSQALNANCLIGAFDLHLPAATGSVHHDLRHEGVVVLVMIFRLLPDLSVHQLDD